MTLSGPNETWWQGTWPPFRLPVIAWRVWFWAGGLSSLTSEDCSWEEVPDLVLAVCAYHSGGRRTFMRYKDAYPCPVDSSNHDVKMGYQVGGLFSEEWQSVAVEIQEDPWRPDEA